LQRGTSDSLLLATHQRRDEGNDPSGQGQNDADQGNHRDFLGNDVAGQGQNDADPGNHRDFLGNDVAGIGISIMDKEMILISREIYAHTCPLFATKYA